MWQAVSVYRLETCARPPACQGRSVGDRHAGRSAYCAYFRLWGGREEYGMAPTISTAPQLRACPKCGHESEPGLQECPRCQVIFAKLQDTEQRLQQRQGPHIAPEFDYLHQLEETQDLVIHQVKERLEIFTGFECKNQYRVMNGMGQQLFLAAEQGEGMSELLMRWFLKAARPFTMQILTPEGLPTIILKRPFRFFFHRIEVNDRNGALLGYVQKRFSVFRRLYTVVDAAGGITEIVGPLFHPWTFHITMGGEPVGSITKKWSGLLTEAFTDADNFGVTFPPKASVRKKALLLGAVFLIDTVHFENKD